MKQFFFVMIALCLHSLLMAQNTLTVNITPGTLKDALSAEELASVTSLTLTGTMDARDFRTLRDEMPLLAVIDLQDVSIEAFTDTTFSTNVLYPANTLPASSPEFGHDFYNNFSLAELPRLTSVTLPESLVTIGSRALKGCTGLTGIIVPPSVLNIQGGAFMDCSALTSVTLPSSVTYLGKEVFSGCSALTEIDLPSSLSLIREKTFFQCTALTSIDLPYVTSIEYRAFFGCSSLQNLRFPYSLISINGSAFEGCTALQTLELPSSLTNIQAQAFQGCTSLTTLSLPRSLNAIGWSAFANCTSLNRINNFRNEPVDLKDSPLVFGGVNTASCTLFVPEDSREAYAQAEQWKDFILLEEMPFTSTLDGIYILKAEGDTINSDIETSMPWTITSDQSWLTIAPSAGTGNGTFTITAAANPSVAQRWATITYTFIIADTFKVDATFVQKGMPKTITLTAGGLSEALTEEELRGITHLTITGEMDARDFMILRQQAPSLEMIDLSKVTITAYEGTEGTMAEDTLFPAHQLPPLAFITGQVYTARRNLTTVLLPDSLISVGHRAFALCDSIKEIIIPEKVTSIGNNAFADCSSLQKITLPSSLTTLGAGTFWNCVSLQSVILPDSITQLPDALFFNCSSLDSVIIPPLVNTIGNEAFLRCKSLSTISIPATVDSIGNTAFYGCFSLKLMEAYPVTPPDLSNSFHVFEGINKGTCILKVPFGSAELYKTAVEWERFKLVEEMPGMKLLADSLIMEAARDTAQVEIKANIPWTLASSQSWLTVSQMNGTGNQQLLITAEANTGAVQRSATVIVSSQGFDSDTIFIQQKGITVGVDEIAQNGPLMTCYPNPFNQRVTIEIQNHGKGKLKVEIYNLSGQRVKSLVKGSTTELLKLSWDGTNDQGQRVPPGIYLCRINDQTKQLVYEGY